MGRKKANARQALAPASLRLAGFELRAKLKSCTVLDSPSLVRYL